MKRRTRRKWRWRYCCAEKLGTITPRRIYMGSEGGVRSTRVSKMENIQHLRGVREQTLHRLNLARHADVMPSPIPVLVMLPVVNNPPLSTKFTDQ